MEDKFGVLIKDDLIIEVNLIYYYIKNQKAFFITGSRTDIKDENNVCLDDLRPTDIQIVTNQVTIEKLKEKFKEKLLEKSFHKSFLIERFIWDKDKDKPHKSLIVGENTNINLGWFELIGSRYQLTERGLKQYKILCSNHKVK